MAAKTTKNAIEGDLLIIKELAKQLNYSDEELNFTIKNAQHGIIAVESLLEYAISMVGNVQRCNKDGQDFVDGSDAKKATVTINDSATGDRAVRIENIANKNGILRVMVAEPMTGEIFYFKIPNHEIRGKKNIKIAFSKDGGIQSKVQKKFLFKEIFDADFDLKSFNERAWLKYRVNSFEELCC